MNLELENIMKLLNTIIDQNNRIEKMLIQNNAHIPDIEVKQSYKDVKKEYFDLDKSFIKECLNMYSVYGDIKIFKKIYIDNIPSEFYPIRNIKKKFQYWNNNHMNNDNNGEYIKNTISHNIEQCYTSINVYDNNDMDDFLRNQDHINQLSDEKYKDLLLSQIVELITI